MNNYIAIGTPITAASVSTGSNFVAAHFSTLSPNSERLWVEFCSATTAEFQLVVDNGSASAVMTIYQMGQFSTDTAANVVRQYCIMLDPRLSYNFRQDTGGTVALWQAFRINPS